MDFSKSDCLYISSRSNWRKWLKENFNKKEQVWLIYPHKSTNKPCLLYNDAVEEALCFGWIDSIRKSYDENNSVQLFTPRRKNSSYSQPNIERIKWLINHNLVHSSLKTELESVAKRDFEFPNDIVDILNSKPEIWNNYLAFSESYKRIRIAFIDSSRNSPEVFEQRLYNFLKHTKANKMIKGFGGIEKYY